MSADNVTPFPSKEQPSKPKKRKPKVGLKFAEGGDNDPTTLHVYQGLRGVCNALDTVGDDINLHADLSSAAAVLIGILENRLA